MFYYSIWASLWLEFSSPLLLWELAELDSVESNYWQIRAPPAFPKFPFCHFALRKEPHEYLFSLSERNPKRISVLEKKIKSGGCGESKNSVQHSFCTEPLFRQQAPGQREWHCPAPSLGMTSSPRLGTLSMTTCALSCFVLLIC